MTQTQEHLSVNRMYKARLFEMVFSDKKELLGLYNAVNGTHYKDPDELEAVFLNINPGCNDEIKKLCKTLSDYVEYTSRVREYTKVMSIETAVERAITECIKEGILAEFLKKNRVKLIS